MPTISRTIALLLALSLLAAACGDDPGPRPGTGEGAGTAGEAEPAQPAAPGPRLDAIRHGAAWRINFRAPRDLPADFVPAEALLEDAEGGVLARRPFAAGPLGFQIESGGLVRAVLLAADGRRLTTELELP